MKAVMTLGRGLGAGNRTEVYRSKKEEGQRLERLEREWLRARERPAIPMRIYTTSSNQGAS